MSNCYNISNVYIIFINCTLMKLEKMGLQFMALDDGPGLLCISLASALESTVSPRSCTLITSYQILP